MNYIERENVTLNYESSCFEAQKLWPVFAIKGLFRLLFVSARIGQNAIATYGCLSRGLSSLSGKMVGNPTSGKGATDVVLPVGEGKIRMDSERKRDNLRAERAPPKATIHRLRRRCRAMPVVWTPRVSLDARKNTRCKINLEIRESIFPSRTFDISRFGKTLLALKTRRSSP